MTVLNLPDDTVEKYLGVQHRAAQQIELLDEEKREVELKAVPYDIETMIGQHLVEVFDKGAFSRAAKDPTRCKLWAGHSTEGGRIVGQAFEVSDRSDGLWLRARVSRTPSGDELLTLAQDKVLDEASIEFAPIREQMVVKRRGDDILVRHHRAHLRGVALVPHGAYGRNALVSSVRDDSDRIREELLAKLRARTA